MVGGKDYRRSAFNRATQARRQPGSAFKMFVYLAAFRAGYTPETPVNDVPIRLGTWQPRNYGDSYRGRINVRDAVTFSSNSVAVQVRERVGRNNVIRAARDLGITSPRLFTMLVLMALVTTFMTTPVLQLLLRGRPWAQSASTSSIKAV